MLCGCWHHVYARAVSWHGAMVDAGEYSTTNIEATITADTTWTAKWTDSYKVVTVDAGDGYFDYYDGDKDVKKAKNASFRVVN